MKKDSLAGKIIAFVVALVATGLIILTSMQGIYAISNNVYKGDVHKELKANLADTYATGIVDSVLWNGYKDYEINDSGVLGAELVGKYKKSANMKGIDGDDVNKKVDKEKSKQKEKVIWQYGNVDNFSEPTEKYVAKNIYWEEFDESESVKYDVVFYLAKDLKKDSNFYAYNQLANWLVKTKNLIYPIGIGALILDIIAFIYLLAAAGHKKGRDEITGSVLTKIPVDVYTGLTAVVGFFTIGGGLAISDWVQISNNPVIMIVIVVLLSYLICGIISLLWLMDMAVRVKKGKWWQSSIIYRALKFIVNGAAKLMRKLPLVPKTVLMFSVISIFELFGILIFSWDLSGGLLILWLIEKIILFAAIMAVALSMRKLKIAGEKIAGGDLDYQVDTSHMFMDFKKHGENLNAIGQGLNAAVDEKLKSERMKTELITNVSHDIKTPLTSIINYTDLMGRELEKIDKEEPNSNTQASMEKIKEYFEVLNRQSTRLKRLIEDLVEASKASTGNLEINLEPMEIGVMLAQTEGEYEDRLSASNLTLMINKPNEPVYVMADGRRMWRVLDNLLNNVCKYALPGTRVYLDLKKDDLRGNAVITLKNISKEPLDISPDELLERFVQGDKARNTEGSGLGLSIANSLTELQGGHLELEIDGDLFKGILTFPLIGADRKNAYENPTENAHMNANLMEGKDKFRPIKGIKGVKDKLKAKKSRKNC